VDFVQSSFTGNVRAANIGRRYPMFIDFFVDFASIIVKLCY
jgi:hypothetical protein